MTTVPSVFWSSAPVKPGETVLVIGDGFGEGLQVRVCRLADGAPGRPDHRGGTAEPSWQTARLLQTSSASLKFLLPNRLRHGCFAFQVGNGGGWSETQFLNRAHLNWHLGDDGATVRPGGELRLFGRHLRLDQKRKPMAACKAAGGKWKPLPGERDTVFLDRPWTVPPDATSMVAINRWKHDLVVVHNRFENTGAAFQSFGIGHDFIIQGNTATRAQGFGVSSLMSAEGLEKNGTLELEENYDQAALRCGFEPNHYMQFIGNRVRQGGMCWCDTYGRRVDSRLIPEELLLRAPQVIGVVFRSNRLEDDSQIKISSDPANEQLPFKLGEDFLIEGNHFRNCRVGIAIDSTNRQVLIRKNKYEHVDEPRVTRSAETLIDEDSVSDPKHEQTHHHQTRRH